MNRNPTHYLHAISLLAYLGADDDGPVSIEADPDEDRRALRRILATIHGDTEGAAMEPDTAESALALVSAAHQLIWTASVDAPDVVDRGLSKIAKSIGRAMDRLEPFVRLAALEAEVERLRLRAAGAAVPVESVARIKEAAPALRDEAAALVPPLVAVPPEPDAPAALADLPVGTITVYRPLGMVRVRLPGGWDLAVGAHGGIYSVAPAPGLEPGPDEDVARIGGGTVPDSWLISHSEVAAIGRAWLVGAPHLVAPIPDGTVPELESLDPSDDDGCPL